MKNGLYEKILNIEEWQRLREEGKKSSTRSVDKSEEARVISLGFQKLLRQILSLKKPEERKSLVETLSKDLGEDELAFFDENFKELLAYHEDEKELKRLKNNRPLTSMASTSLITGTHGPSLVSELVREIHTADRIDLLVSFIKFSGFRLIQGALEEFTKTKSLRVITTSYMGASDYKAVLELSKLPNTQVKISYDKDRTRLHAKTYYFERETGYSTAYIGSSNISNPALTSGLEWNLKISQYTSEDALNTLKRTFETYWGDDEFVLFDPNSVQERRLLEYSLEQKSQDGEEESYVFFDLRPYSHQKEILEDLRYAREENQSYRNLVVAATGTGKTMVAAFDYKEFKKENPSSSFLFLAHRKEILLQSRMAFRNVLRDQNFGKLWVDGEMPRQYDHVFASIQSLTFGDKYLKFSLDHFDYIVIDETHHASASSYLRILEHFQPKILLGLTATPERMDGADITDYFDNRIASEIRLKDAIDRKLLSPFHYFGVSDPEDLSHIKWSRGGYDISELEKVYTKSKQRVEVVLDSMKRYLKDMKSFKALGFCVSVEHANFMAHSFNKVNIPSMALSSQSSREDRDKAKNLLTSGQLNCIFTVDLFNEGVDIPEVDTVLFLRPTESLTVFLQQLGRGLRLSEDKEVLTVLDYVGQAHQNYDFAPKLRALIGRTNRKLKTEIENEFPNMPAGCHLHLEEVAMEHILKNIQSSIMDKRGLRKMVRSYSMNFEDELNLKNFMDNYDLDVGEFYCKTSFYQLLWEEGKRDKYEVENINLRKTSLRRIGQMNSKSLIDFSLKFLSNQEVQGSKERIKTLLAMLYYTIFPDKPDISYKDSFMRLFKEDLDFIKEAIEILQYKKEKLNQKEVLYEEKSIPLDIYAQYFMEQITASFGLSNEGYKRSVREGVLYIKDKNIDLIFITLNKNDKDYLPTTMYNDYAINSQFFHWETQSTTGVDSPTGKRYLSQDPDHKILVFVREEKRKYGQTSPYTFLGRARYSSHKGSKPIQIVLRMDRPIPEKIIRQSNLTLAQ